MLEQTLIRNQEARGTTKNSKAKFRRNKRNETIYHNDEMKQFITTIIILRHV